MRYNRNILVDINRVMVFVAELALVALMVITTYSVVARYVFRKPSIHAVEITTYLLLVLAWCSIGWTHHLKRHVSMELLRDRLGPRARLVQSIISELVILLFCGVLANASFHVALTAFERNYRSTSLLKFPMGYAYGMIMVGAITLAVAVIYSLYAIITQKPAIYEGRD